MEGNRMFGDVVFPQHSWTQFGVKRIVKDIPGQTRCGVLAPGIMIGTGDASAKAVTAAEDIKDLFHQPPMNIDLTTVPIIQREFVVMNSGFEVPVTEYCAQALDDTIQPGVVYFHGGAWRMGSRKHVENPMRLLAQLSGARVFSVEYRLAPAFMFPCATNDGWKALKYIFSHADVLRVDPSRITVAGDSAGGNIAAACSRRNRNMRTRMIQKQVLFYPVLSQVEPEGKDYHFSLDDYEFDDSEAKWIVPRINSIALTLPGSKIYVENPEDAVSPDASPLLDNNFGQLPETLIICAEYDYLTQQAKTYARRIAAADGSAALMVYRGTDHGFATKLGICPQATDAIKEAAEFVNSIQKPIRV